MRFVDSHTEGEPTRVFLSEGAPARTLAETQADRAQSLDALRALVAEPRAPAAAVGALLCRASDDACAFGVLFFNAAGMLGMCGHGMIGLAVTLFERGLIPAGEHRFETPVGRVTARVYPEGAVEVDNVESRRTREGVLIDVDGRTLRGDVAWGGNWFFLVDEDSHRLEGEDADRLLAESKAIRAALARQAIRGDEEAPIDHVAFFGPPRNPALSRRNFVLCPNDAFDRSPCGTGTSAKLACLAASGALRPGERWRQESFIGSRFDAWYRPSPRGEGRILPSIRGRAWITGEGSLRVDANDPTRFGGWLEES